MAPPKDQKQGQAGASSRQLEAVPERRSGQLPLAGGKSPTGQIPVQGTGASKQSLPQVPARSPTGQIPVQGTGASKQSLPQVPSRSPTGQIPVQGGNSKASLPQVPTRTTTGSIPIQGDPATSGAHPMPGVNTVSLDPSQVNKARLTEVQKIQNNDAFASWGAQRKRANFIATPTDPGSMKAVQEEEWIDPDYNPDGSAPLPECIGRETWRALKAPFTSKEGKRTKELYEHVFKQFAIGFNDRYDEDAPGKPRGHIYVWDVSRAMNCEIPHFAGARELSLAQTVDWLKHEGPMRGWLKIPELDAPGLANKGLMVVVIPREVKLRQIAIVTPQDPKGGLLLTGAGLVVGADVPLRDMLGTAVVDCYYHP